MTACRCAHSRIAHEHYRAGSDCALCECPQWKRRPWWLPVIRGRKL